MRDYSASPETRSSTVPFHEQIEALRIERGLTQHDLAAAVGMSIRAYSSFENGHTKRLRAENRRALRAFFNLDNDVAAGGEGTRHEWPNDVRVFLDMLGAFLVTMDEPERLEFVHDATRWIVARRR